MSVKPFVRWAGGKTQLLPQLIELAPKQFRVYHEPFVGGGALYYALKPDVAVLNDYNPRLVNAFVQVRDDVQSVVSHMQTFQRTASCYYDQRNLLNAEDVGILDTQAAARFIFLNKTCFNGLWRENSSGGFNVPYGGDRKRAKFLDVSSLLDCSIRLRRNTTIFCKDFEYAVRARVQPGDFVYFDPPYIPLTATSFVDYTSDGFGYQEQVRLRDLVLDLKTKGVQVMLSNSDTTLTRQLYAGFEVHEVKARRSINRNAAGRGRVGELIIK